MAKTSFPTALRRMLLGFGALSLIMVATLFYISSLPLPTPPPPAVPGMPQVVFAPSADGWELAFSHYPPCWRGQCVDGAIPKEPLTPVILCHGMAVNRYNWDLSEGRSLARTLSDRGFDVWNLELRGHGLSRHLGPDAPHPWGMKEYMEEDMPAAIEFVRQRTGADKVHWVGHSMGALILMGHLAHHPDSPIASGVVASAPGHLRDRDGRLKAVLDMLPHLPHLGMAFPAPVSMRLTSRFTGKPSAPEFAWIPDNVEDEAGRWFMAQGMADVQEGELDGMAKMYEEGDLVSRDGEIRYYQMFKDIRTPLLFMVGAADVLASPASVKHLYDEAGSADKAYVVLGKAEGFSADYGHGDVCLGDHAEAEVYPVITDWLVKHLPAPAAPDQTPPGELLGGDEPL